MTRHRDEDESIPMSEPPPFDGVEDTDDEDDFLVIYGDSEEAPEALGAISHLPRFAAVGNGSRRYGDEDLDSEQGSIEVIAAGDDEDRYEDGEVFD